MFEHQPRRSGKSLLMRLALDAALDKGERVCVVGIGRDGEMHYCHVIPHPTRIKNNA